MTATLARLMAATVAAAVAVDGAVAAATPFCRVDPDPGDCSTALCRIECNDEEEYIVFGYVSYQKEEGAPINYGWGVCYWSLKVVSGVYQQDAFIDAVYTVTEATQYAVLADYDASDPSRDALRLADADGWEDCGTGWPQIRITGQLPEDSGYIFDGMYGTAYVSLNDVLSTSQINNSSHSPDCSEILAPVAWASDGAGSRVYGSYCNDWIFGGTYYDYLWGGAGADYIAGGNGNDTIKGGYGCDYLYGNNNTDTCYCEDGGGYADTCELPTGVPDCGSCD